MNLFQPQRTYSMPSIECKASVHRPPATALFCSADGALWDKNSCNIPTTRPSVAAREQLDLAPGGSVQLESSWNPVTDDGEMSKPPVFTCKILRRCTAPLGRSVRSSNQD
jgi:hypothetical protein